MNYKKPAFWGVVLAVIACVAVAVCFLTNPLPIRDRLELLVSDTGAEGYALTYRVDLGRTVNGGSITAEHWQNGKCTKAAPLTFDAAAKQISLKIIPHRAEDGLSIAAFEVQYWTDQTPMTTAGHFPIDSGKTVRGYAFSAFEPDEVIPIEAKDELFLAVLSIDSGNGALSMDCRSLDRVQDADDLIVIRASFPAESAESAELEKFYLTIGAEGVTRIDLSGPGYGGGCMNADGSPFMPGEEVWLEPLDGRDDLRGLEIFAMNANGEVLWSASVPDDEENRGFRHLTQDGWRITNLPNHP